MTAPDGPGSVSPAALRRAVAAAAIGNAMEWFDFGVYNYLSVTIGRVFFPDADPGAERLAALAAFAAAFVVRPVGGAVLGPLGDRIGRRRVLAATMLMMAAGTFAIGLIPPRRAIGLAAPALLLAARLLQGFSTGGEYGGAMIFVAEYAPPARRGYLCSWLEFGTCAGFLLGALIAAGLAAALPPPAMVRWGWRVPFLLAGPFGLVGLYIRSGLEETPAFRALSRAAPRGPGDRTTALPWRAIGLCMALVVAFNIPDFIVLSYMPAYVAGTLGVPEGRALGLLCLVLAAMMALVPAAGALDDRVGRRRVILGCCALHAVLALPCFLLIRTGGAAGILAGLFALAVPLAGLIGSMPATLPTLFPVAIRYGALAIAYNLAISAFGGTAPPIIDWLIRRTGDTLVPAYYLVASACLGLLAAWRLRDSRPAA